MGKTLSEKRFPLGNKIDGNYVRAFWEDDVKQAVKELKENKRFKQTGGDLRDELGLNDAQMIQRIQLMFTEVLLDIDKIFGDTLIDDKEVR